MDSEKFHSLINSINSGQLSIIKIQFVSLDSQQTGELAQALEASESITEFHLFDVNIKIGNLFTIISALKNKESIVSLSIKKSGFDPDAPEVSIYYFPLICIQIQTLKNLAFLDLGYLEFNEDLAKTLIEILPLMGNLRELVLAECGIDDSIAPFIATLVQSSKTLKVLDISSNQLQGSGVVTIVKALSRNNTLSSINFSNNQKVLLNKEVIQTFREVIPSLSALTALYFNQFGNCSNWGLDKKSDTTELISVLLLSNSFVFLSLDHFPIGIRGTVFLAQWIENNQTIKHLSLVDTKINLNTFFNALLHNTTLEYLNLNENYITQADEGIIARVIKHSKSLTQLNLRNTRLSDKNILLIAESLCFNQSIRVLDLSNNQIGNAGIQSIAKILENNKTLTSVNLDLNSFDSEGAEFLYKALKKNIHLTFLQLPIKNIDRKLRVDIQLEVNENVQLRRDVIILAILLAQSKRQSYFCTNESSTRVSYFKALPVDVLFLIFNLVTQGIEQPKPFLSNLSIFNRALSRISTNENGDKRVIELKPGSDKQIDFYKKGNKVRKLFSKEIIETPHNHTTQATI